MSWSKRIRIVFDRKVYNVTPDLKDYFRLIETTYGTYIYPTNVTYGVNYHEIYLEFKDFYRAVQPLSLEYLGGTSFGGKDFVMEPFFLMPVIINVNPSDVDEHLTVSSIDVNGEIKVAFDGKLYSDEYYLQVDSISVSGINILLQFNQRYSAEYLQLADITIAGEIKHVDDIEV